MVQTSVSRSRRTVTFGRRTVASTSSRLSSQPVARPGAWLAARGCTVRRAGAGPAGFGEWCAARHSLDYGALPDWWLLFDIYDRRAGAFWSTARRDAWARRHGFARSAPFAAGGRCRSRNCASWCWSRAQCLSRRSAGRRGDSPRGWLWLLDRASWCGLISPGPLTPTGAATCWSGTGSRWGQ